MSQTHTKTFSLMDAQGGTKRKRNLEARYRHKETERPALTQEEMCIHSDLHRVCKTERFLQKEGRDVERH